MEHWRAFNYNWFMQHQEALLSLLKYSWFRKLMHINDRRPVVRILPNAIHFANKDNTYTYEGRIHHKYSKRMYHAFKYLWWFLHSVDWLVLDRQTLVPSFGFYILTSYPDAHTETSSCDGNMTSSITNQTTFNNAWNGARNGMGTTSTNDSGATGYFFRLYTNQPTGGRYDATFVRGLFGYDLSSVSAAASINTAVFSIYPTGNVATGPSGNVNISSGNPSLDTAIAFGDWGTGGATSYASKAVNPLGGLGYEDFTLDASGRTYVAGYFSSADACFFMVWEETDRTNSTLGWSPSLGVPKENSWSGYFADQTGTANDPKLVINYTLHKPSQRIIVVN